MSELKPCPFCKRKAITTLDGKLAKCGNMSCAMSTWQNRPAEDSLRAENDALQQRVAVLEQQLAETEGYPGNAADMLKLLNRVGELEGELEQEKARCSRLSTSCGMAGYRLLKAKRESGRHYCRYREMLEAQVADSDNALTPPATEKEGE